MTYHVLTPFSRTWNLIELGNILKSQGVLWHLLSVEGEARMPDLGDWIIQHFMPPPPKDFFIGHWLVNKFLDAGGVIDDDRYLVLTDDDATEDGFFRKLDQYDDDILIVSMQRSNAPTGIDPGCPFGTLIACPENMRVAHVGFEQLVVKGKVLKEYRCESVYHADGLLLEKMWADRMERFKFVPDARVYFNRLPPGYHGRWNR